ncbi:MAG: hypothetical protein WCF25_02655 [Acidimicrobiales bacterium]
MSNGAGAPSTFFLGQLAEMHEQTWALNAYHCPTCHHVELFDANVPSVDTHERACD